MNKVAGVPLATLARAANTTVVQTQRMRCAIGKVAAGNVSGAVPLSSRSDLKNHPATIASLTWLYDSPAEVGGWLGGIEPEAGSWIAFVATDGKTFLWEKRDKSGGVIGVPVVFDRKDLITGKVAAEQQRIKCEKTPQPLGKSAASGRFRIFPEGKFMTDYGPSVMTPKAGQEIIKKFRARGNNMMIDLRHFSISPTATAKQSEALGWVMQPNGLEYVNGDGLYATGVRWDPEIKAGLESEPPKWMYHSPYYDQDKKTKVITELLNIALTNMPATHNHSLLAAERSGPMDLKMLGALMLALSMAADAGDETAKSYLAQLTAGMGDQAQAALDAASADNGPASVEDPMMAGMSEDDKTVMAGMNEDQKAKYAAGVKAMAAPVAAAAPADEKEVAAAAPVDDKVACGMDLHTLETIAAGIDAQNIDAKKKMVTEAIRAGLVPKSMESHLMNSTEQVAATFIAGRRNKVVTIGGPVAKKIGAPAPLTKTDPLPGVSKEDRIAAEALSKKTGTPVKDLLAQMVDKG